MKRYVIQAILDVECQWKHIKWRLLYGFIVDFHIVKDSFFIWQVEIVLHVVGHSTMVTRLIILFIVNTSVCRFPRCRCRDPTRKRFQLD